MTLADDGKVCRSCPAGPSKYVRLLWFPFAIRQYRIPFIWYRTKNLNPIKWNETNDFQTGFMSPIAFGRRAVNGGPSGLTVCGRRLILSRRNFVAKNKIKMIRLFSWIRNKSPIVIAIVAIAHHITACPVHAGGVGSQNIKKKQQRSWRQRRRYVLCMAFEIQRNCLHKKHEEKCGNGNATAPMKP